MTRIGVRELRQHASAYLAEVKAGGTVEITERGVLVAVLRSATPASSARERLIAEGRLVPAAAPFDPPARRFGAPGGVASDALDRQRSDRLG